LVAEENLLLRATADSLEGSSALVAAADRAPEAAADHAVNLLRTAKTKAQEIFGHHP
jgi:hypothetical protein